MSQNGKMYHLWMHRRRTNMSATQVIALAFAGIILLGAILLTLPVASRNGVSCGFLTALFTATSSTCVTGLVVADTWVQWSGFGQIVILILIQIGGLGFMSAASLVFFLLRKRVGLKQRLVMAQALSVTEMQGVVRLQKLVLIGSLTIEGIGALILMVHFWPTYGFLKALTWGIFHSVTAFCNAGFDIFGYLQPDSSLSLFQSDPVVLLTIATLIVLGGLGFLVWEELAHFHTRRRLSVYTKLVLITTAVLIAGGTCALLLLEWDNPATLGSLSRGDRVLNAFFQSVSSRTAGFAAIDQGGLTDAGKMVTTLLMLIGGSSGSTAGGIKTVTLMTLMLFLWSRARGKGTVSVMKRTIPATQVMDAMTVAGIMISLAIFGGIFISAVDSFGFMDSLFEAASALGTVGFTTGITSSLSVASKILIIVYMYFGRVGVMTLSLGFLMGNQAEERFRYAQTNLLIG